MSVKLMKDQSTWVGHKRIGDRDIYIYDRTEAKVREALENAR